MTLAEWMTRNGLGDQDVAERVGVDRTTISRVRRGKGTPSGALVAALLKLSGGKIDAASFFTERAA